MYFLIFLTTLAFLTEGFAYDRRPSLPCKPLCKEAQKNEIFFNVDLLVWDAREEGLEYAYQNSGTLFDQELTSFEPHTKFEPAFRLGLGGFLPYDSWTLGATY